MSDITSAVRSICVVTACIFIISSITEGTRLRRQAGFILKFIFAIAVVSSFVGGIKNIELPDISLFESGDYCFSTDSFDSAVAQQTAANITDVLRSQLSSVGIDAEKIDVDVNISKESGISINRVIIRTAEFDRAAEIIRSSLGQETEVINGNS